MKILVALDDSSESKHVVDLVCKRRWPRDVQIKVLSVFQPLPPECECECESMSLSIDLEKQRRTHVESVCEHARARINKDVPSAITHFDIREGDPKQVIPMVAAEWEADRILIGAHGHSACPRFGFGSVSRAVAHHAHCTVEVLQARERKTPATV